MIPTIETKFTKSGAVTFAYREFGNGFPLVLFQRFRGTMDEWDPAFIHQIALRNKVIVFDNVGIGLTEGDTPSTIGDIVKDAFSFTQALGLKYFNILGWSFGGIVAQVFVLNYPKYVNKVVLVGTGPAGSRETVYPTDRFLEIARHEVNTPEDHQILFFTETRDGYQETLKSLKRISEWSSTPIAATKKENWMAQSLAMRDFFTNRQDYFGKLKEIKHPTLVGGAKNDLAFPFIDAFLLAREIPNATLVVYPNAGHAFHHQLAEEFGSTINSFLNENNKL